MERSVSASTQNQALSALLFLYTQVLQLELGRIGAAGEGVCPRAANMAAGLGRVMLPDALGQGVRSKG